MTFVVTDNCIKCKYTDCVEVCPVDCFYEGPNFLVIHPDECIDCALCEPECPAVAIFSEDEVPDEMQEFIQLNVDLAFDAIPLFGIRQDQRPRTLITAAFPKRPLAGLFAFQGKGFSTVTFLQAKKRGGMTRPHFSLFPVVLFIVLMNRFLRCP